MERRENWEKSRRNSTDNWCCWHYLYPFQSQRHTAVAHGAVMPMLLSGTIFAFCGTGLGWVRRWVCVTWGSQHQHSSCGLTASQIEIIQQPVCQHSHTAGLVAVPKHGESPELWNRPKQHFCLGPVSGLAPCSKQRGEVRAGFLLMRLCMSFSRDVSH